MTKTTIDLSKISSQFEGVSAKVAVTLRNLDLSGVHGVTQNVPPSFGDIALFKVKSVGEEPLLQSFGGRAIELHEGDKILAPYGTRYAVEKCEGFVPSDMGECHLIARGGVAGVYADTNEKTGDPTVIMPMGILSDKSGNILNMKDFSMNSFDISAKRRPVNIMVFGTGMDAGKTTAASAIVKGMTRSGHKVGFGKMTGTGAFSDIHKPEDAGAIAVADFVDMGYPSTYKVETKDLVGILEGLTGYLSIKGSDVNVIEIADGVFQSDNQKLLRSEDFKSRIDGVFIAANEGLSAMHAVEELVKHDIPVLGVGGIMMCAPLTVREFEQNIETDAKPVFGPIANDDLEKREAMNNFLSYIHEQNPDRKFKTQIDEDALDNDASLEL